MFELQDITAGYGSTIVLRSASMRVPPGSVVALIGPNGAGKTTLLRVASGLLRPHSGRVRLDEQDLTGRPSHVFFRAGICHVPEGRGIFRSLTVRENLILQAPPGTSASDALDRAMSAFPRLGERISQQAGTLSGGEQQMLALSHAYVSRSSVVLLDEVSLGLAPRIVDEIFAFLKLLAHEGVALLIVEQYVNRVLDIADFLFVLTRGTVSFAGEPAEVDTSAILTEYLGIEVATT